MHENTHKSKVASTLRRVRDALVADDLDQATETLLLNMLNENIEGLKELDNHKLYLEPETIEQINKSLAEAFSHIQDAIEGMEEDSFENKWRCKFSNRVMHRSMKQQKLERMLVDTQRSVYNILNFTTENNATDHLLDNVEDFYETDFKFRRF